MVVKKRRNRNLCKMVTAGIAHHVLATMEKWIPNSVPVLKPVLESIRVKWTGTGWNGWSCYMELSYE